MDASSDTHIRILFEMTGEMLCVATMDGEVLLLNPAWERIVGYTPAEIMSRPFSASLHADDVEPFRMAFRGLRAGLPLRGHIARFEHRDGSSRWLHWEAMPHSGLVYALARDVTDEIESSERVGRLQIALRRNAATLGGTLSHAEAMLRDLRTLHGSIIASLQTPTLKAPEATANEVAS